MPPPQLGYWVPREEDHDSRSDDGAMNIWTIHLGEPVSVDQGRRPMRYGLLADSLERFGHEVTQWAPTFDHFRKQQRAESDVSLRIGERRHLELLFGKGYSRHIGLKRILFHREIANRFRERARAMPRPDLIVSSIPTIELSVEALRYGREFGVPVVVDIRDLWPDALFGLLPKSLVPVAKALAKPAVKNLRFVCREATELLAVSESYLQWGLGHAGRDRRSGDRVLPLGYEKPFLSEVERRSGEAEWERQGVGADRDFRICYFGSLGNSTDMASVLEVAARLQRDGDNGVQFVLCGEGPNLERYRSAAKDLKNVVFPGWANPKAIQTLMQRSDIGIAPYARSAVQSIPNKPIEYLGGGLPVVTSLGGELASLLSKHQCGQTFDIERPETLYEVVKNMRFTREATESMKRNALRVFEETFDASRVYPQMVGYLADVVRNRNNVRTLAA